LYTIDNSNPVQKTRQSQIDPEALNIRKRSFPPTFPRLKSR
jgi:hypothetical protein